ncbi:hypothetical protein GCM10007874_36740 [Labrys miyagiensis]|uniref:Polyhydroxyalkanoic acid system protein n=1 Tax=Labrys miyagiensis TaxID=346912 RepID=A0ABQ6CJX1_9HYPH|nr:hypothetical protein [Labrys miyagiensis]GLS20657.1 hypothetical protein GCM10007874_36740 [Labrys miyagiensis]
MPAISGSKRLILGREHDEALRAGVLAVLRGHKAQTRASSWDIGGCQEVSTLRFTIEGQEVTLTSGTNAGLALEGPAALVDRIRMEVGASLSLDMMPDSRQP